MILNCMTFINCDIVSCDIVLYVIHNCIIYDT